MTQRAGRSWTFLGVALALAGGSPVGAQKAPAVGAEQAYVEYLKAVHGGDASAFEGFLGPEGAAQWKALPAAGRGMASAGLAMPGLYEPPKAVKVDTVGEGVVLHLAATVDTQRTYTGTPGQPVAVTGRVEMKRRAGGWTMVSETWQTSDGKPYWSGLVAPGVIPEAMAGKPVDWATGDIRTVISAQAAYQSADNGYYGTLECLARPAQCLERYPTNGPEFIRAELLSPAARYGFKRRFDEGARAPAQDVGPGKASRSSIASYAYWIIPEPAIAGARARCGDASGVLCEMPDATAPPTKGACPSTCVPLR